MILDQSRKRRGQDSNLRACSTEVEPSLPLSYPSETSKCARQALVEFTKFEKPVNAARVFCALLLARLSQEYIQVYRATEDDFNRILD